VPIVHGLRDEYSHRITFRLANIHDKTTFDLQAQLGFTATPEFFLLDADGTILGHWGEEVTESALRLAFDKVPID